jgi:putative transposase
LPRSARIKFENGIYHIMVRSLSEILLFRSDDDKEVYLKLFKKYQQFYIFKIYGYCAMNNHAHFIINSNGADISTIMHKINQCYAQYYNRKYNRHGHVFEDRFKSKIIDSDKYLLTLSAYIHNNPVDISEYRNCVENYRYSSFGIFMGIKDHQVVDVDMDFILQHFNSDLEIARKRYKEFVDRRREVKISELTKGINSNVSKHESVPNLEFENRLCEYRSGRKLLTRDLKPAEIIDFIAAEMKTSGMEINIKYSRIAAEFRAVCSLIMSSLCNMRHSDIGTILGNITCSQVSNLCARGYTIIKDDEKFAELIPGFLERFSA